MRLFIFVRVNRVKFFSSCFSIIGFTEFLSYKLYTIYEKESVATKCSTDRLFWKNSLKAESLLIKKFFSGCRSASLLWKHSITTVFWMILWNFSEQTSLTVLVRSPMAKIITWLRKQTNTRQENAWDTNKLLDCSSLIIVYYC